MSKYLIAFFHKWNKYISEKIKGLSEEEKLPKLEKQRKHCLKLYDSFSKGPIDVNGLKESLEGFMSYEFTLPSVICDWREPIPPFDLMGWLVILNRCPHLGNTYTVKMFLEGKFPETAGNPLKSEPCGCLNKGSCSSHLAMLGFMFNHTKITWQDLDKTMFFTEEEIEERDEADKKNLFG